MTCCRWMTWKEQAVISFLFLFVGHKGKFSGQIFANASVGETASLPPHCLFARLTGHGKSGRNGWPYRCRRGLCGRLLQPGTGRKGNVRERCPQAERCLITPCGPSAARSSQDPRAPTSTMWRQLWLTADREQNGDVGAAGISVFLPGKNKRNVFFVVSSIDGKGFLLYDRIR